MSSQNSKKLVSYVFTIMQYEHNTKTGEDLHFNEDVIKKALEHKTIKMWAYVCHNKDVYSEEDELKDPSHKQGDPKPAHWHVDIWLTVQLDVVTIAEWFGVPPQYVVPKKGKSKKFINKSVFYDMVFYLTHKDVNQQIQGKHVYEFSELHQSPNLDIEKELQTSHALTFIASDGSTFSDKTEFYRYEFIYGGKTILSLRENDKAFYTLNFKDVKAWRNDYLSFMEKPEFLINIYVCGSAGKGKDVFSRSLARYLVRGSVDFDDPLPDETSDYLEIGGDKVTFEKYDGQKVIIWSDIRANTIARRFNGFENVLSTFDVVPHNTVQHVKFGSVNLVNSYNILNGIQPFQTFVDALRNGEDEAQLKRRFPICIEFNDDMTIKMSCNIGFFHGTSDYLNYEPVEVRNNTIFRLVKESAEDALIFRAITDNYCESITNKVKEAEAIITHHDYNFDRLEDIIRESAPGLLPTWLSWRENYGDTDEFKKFLRYGSKAVTPSEAVPAVSEESDSDSPLPVPEEGKDNGNN